MRRLRIVVADRCADLRSTMSALLDLEPDMRCLATAGTSHETLQALRDHRPDAVVVDVLLEDEPGIPLIAALRARAPATTIIVPPGSRRGHSSKTAYAPAPARCSLSPRTLT